MNEQENITPKANPIPEEWLNESKKRNPKKIIIILLIIVLVLSLTGGSFYFITTNIDKKTSNNTTTTSTSEETSKESEQYTSTPPDILDRMKIRNAEKKEEYTKTINGKEHKFTFYYYYEDAKIETIKGTYPNDDIVKEDGYNYILSLYEDDSIVSRYVIGYGLTKEEASTKVNYSKERPDYNINMITTIKDTATNEEYPVYLIPECFNRVEDDRMGVFITSPTIRRENRSIIKTIKTSKIVMGTIYPSDPKYGFNDELIYKNHGTYRIEDNKIYYIEESECSGSPIDISILQITNGKTIINTINNVDATGSGQC